MQTISSEKQGISEDELARRCFHNRKGLCRNIDSPTDRCVMCICPYWISWDKELRSKLNEKLPEGLKINWNQHVEISHLVSANMDLALLAKVVD